MKKKKRQYVEVPVEWFEGLLKYAEKVEGNLTKREKMEKIPHKVTMLLGYVSSAESILKYGKKFDYQRLT
jgi:hypothetical protein